MKGLRTWLEIDREAIKNNLKIFRARIAKKTALMAVVKSNAYGHGLTDFSRLVQNSGADWLGVDSIVEAEALRKAGIKKQILVLGSTLPEKIKIASDQNINLTISSFNDLKKLRRVSLNRFSVAPKIHLKIDTGMHRQGFLPEEIPAAIRVLKSKSFRVAVAGVYTHFAAAKNPSFPKDTLIQIEKFRGATDMLMRAGFNPLLHAAATSGTLLFPKAHFDIVRVGIGLYGLWPSKEVEAAFTDGVKLKPALAWKSVIGEVKKIPAGSRIGYDFTEKLNSPSKIAVIPIGYWHGYPRALSSIGHALVRGKRAKILGRVTMDMITIDVTKIKNVRAGDIVTLIGRDVREEVSADELADLSGSVNYEIITRVNPLIKRNYI